MKTKYTDYDNCLTNISSSVLKHFNVEWDKPTLKEVDEAIINKKKIIVMLLDGMGINIINKNLDKDSFITKHIKKPISSVFPPTTAAATTALLSGLNPIESGWLGWHLYLSCKDPSLILFRNVDYYKDKVYKNLSVNEKIGYKSIIDYINDNGYHAFSIYPSFMKKGYKTFDEALIRQKEILDKYEESFTYFYWDCPDALIHEFGTNGDSVYSFMQYVNERLEKFSKAIDDDTVIILVADHGLVDVEAIDFSRFKDLNKMLKKKPSCEGRCNIYHVKKKEVENFKTLFNYYLDDYFDLYTKQEVLDIGIFGDSKNIHSSVKYSLGDYVAIAKDKYYLTNDLSFVFKGHHAGGLKEESEIPLIIINKE